ncbi:MAG: hypothetical protein H6617_00255 [Bdellovibrionaceae bacterium]|nr:hypothetical protein [Pseudobdellovibrionaceae bacterium]
MRVVVGKSGDTNEEVVQQVLATLDRFKQQGTLPEDNTVTEAFEGLSTDPKYGRLRNVGLLAANSQDVPTKLFYATADGAKLDVATPGPGGFTLPAGKTLARKEAVKLPEKYKTQDTWLPGAKAPAVAKSLRSP